MTIPRNEAQLRRALCRFGRLLHRGGMVAGTAGNLSARLEDGRLLVTPRGVRKDALRPRDLVLVDPERPADDALAAATTEWPAHRDSYGARPGVGAVIHSHAPASTAAGLRGLRLADHLPEVGAVVGGVASVPFHPSGSDDLGGAVATALRTGASVLLLQGHGVLAVGGTLEEAFDRMELAELAARTVLLAHP